MTPAYRAVRRIARWLAQVYYPDLAITGAENVPAGPLVVAANHPNSIFDPVLIAAAFPRPIRWLAKAPLFDSPPARLVLDAFGVIPVKRRHEGGDRESTAALLHSAAAALVAGKAIGIFPEGTTHDAPRLLPLKTGVGRIAVLAASEAPAGTRVRVLPVVLYFADKARFRSEAAVAIGQPFEVGAGDDPEAVTRLVRARLEESLVHVEDDGQERLLAAVRELEGRRLSHEAGATDPAGRHRVDVQIARALRRFAAEEPERVERFQQRLLAHLERLERQGISPQALDDGRSFRESRIRRGAIAAALLPIALYGLLHSWVPYRLTGWLARTRARTTDRTTLAWYRTFGGAVIFPVTWLMEAALVAWAWSIPAALLFLATVLPTGLVARWVFHVVRRQLGRLRDLAVIGTQPEVAAALREERAWLMAEMERWRRLHVGEEERGIL